MLVRRLSRVPGCHRLEELGRLEEQLREAEPLVERARPTDVGDAEGDVVHALCARRARERPPEARPFDQLELAAPRIGDVGDVERHVVRLDRRLERLHQRLRPGGDEVAVDLRDAARVQADLADPELPPPAARRRRRWPDAVEDLHELDRAGPDRRRTRVAEHHHTCLPIRSRNAARVVEAQLREADRSRRTPVPPPCRPRRHRRDRRHGTSCCRRFPEEAELDEGRADLGKRPGIVDRQAWAAGLPPGCPSIFMIAFSWLW